MLSLWAGVDALLDDQTFPRHIPLARMVDPLLAVDMTHFAIHWVLHFHRGLHRYRAQQKAAEWKQHPYPIVSERHIGIMGLGRLGASAAKTLAGLGFAVAGCDAVRKEIEGVQTFAGNTQLPAFLEATAILIVLLPLTNETRGIINVGNLAKLPAGSFLISLGRGGHIVDEDLVAALDTGKLDTALLDTFTEESLPAGHPFWHHPRIIVTPHIASKTTPQTSVAEIAIDVRRLLSGKPPRNTVDHARGF